LLLGVGRATDADGRHQGLQLSLFDVSDPAAPKRLAQQVLPAATTEVETQPHAFTFVDGTVLVPFLRTVSVPLPQRFAGNSGPAAPSGARPSVIPLPGLRAQVDSGVVAVRVTGRRLSAPVLLRPRGSVPSARTGLTTRPGLTFGLAEEALRTFVGNGDIWTVTTRGVGVHDASTFRWLGYTPFAS